MNRSEIINYLIEKKGYKSYLEIGMDNPENNFLKIKCELKESCDPYMNDDFDGKYDRNDLPKIVSENLTYRMTSDEMFNINDKKYDIIFIDGLHEYHQVYRDILNSLSHLNEGGVILVHDCLPANISHATYPRETSGVWNGTTWYALYILDQIKVDFNVIDTDFGIGIIPFQDVAQGEYEFVMGDYSQVFSNIYIRNKMLNVISENEFVKKY